MNIVMVTGERFPFGAACTNRVLTYVLELSKNGYIIDILCFSLRGEDNITLVDDKGFVNYQGINIHYLNGNKKWPDHGTKRMYKLLYLLKSFFTSLLYIIKNRKNINIIQNVCNDGISYWIYGLLANFLEIPYVIEKTEYPEIVKNKNFYSRNFWGIIYKHISQKSFKMFDGWLLETQNLYDYYSKFFKKNAEYCLVPITVDLKRFDDNLNKNINTYGRYIAYCGNMQEVDGVSILIKAFSIVASKYTNINLILAGISDDIPGQKKLVTELGIEDRVKFIGFVERDSVPSLLYNAEMLALASPTSLRSCATMPIKIPEYCATGRPVVVTSLGEINKYFIDGYNAYLAEPDDANKFADKIIEVLSNPNKAKEVGERGRELTIEKFSNANLIKHYTDFYNSICRRFSDA